jgi:hypothetical protein
VQVLTKLGLIATTPTLQEVVQHVKFQQAIRNCDEVDTVTVFISYMLKELKAVDFSNVFSKLGFPPEIATELLRLAMVIHGPECNAEFQNDAIEYVARALRHHFAKILSTPSAIPMEKPSDIPMEKALPTATSTTKKAPGILSLSHKHTHTHTHPVRCVCDGL